MTKKSQMESSSLLSGKVGVLGSGVVFLRFSQAIRVESLRAFLSLPWACGSDF